MDTEKRHAIYKDIASIFLKKHSNFKTEISEYGLRFIENESGFAFAISNPLWAKNKASCYACSIVSEANWHFKHKVDEISFSLTKAPSVIVKDIERRFFEAWQLDSYRLANELLDHKQYIEKIKKTRNELAAIFKDDDYLSDKFSESEMFFRIDEDKSVRARVYRDSIHLTLSCSNTEQVAAIARILNHG